MMIFWFSDIWKHSFFNIYGNILSCRFGLLQRFFSPKFIPPILVNILLTRRSREFTLFSSPTRTYARTLTHELDITLCAHTRQKEGSRQTEETERPDPWEQRGAKQTNPENAKKIFFSLFSCLLFTDCWLIQWLRKDTKARQGNERTFMRLLTSPDTLIAPLNALSFAALELNGIHFHVFAFLSLCSEIRADRRRMGHDDAI